jgi:hypothetical protein
VFPCLSTVLVALVDTERSVGISGLLPNVILLLLAIVHCALLWVLLGPGQPPGRGRLLATLMLCS